MIETPVTIIVFNRPHTTSKVFSRIAEAKPRKLFVVADGPRKDHPDDVERCAETRSIFDQVDWDCEVSKRFLDVNIGCGKGPAEGISWVFEKVEQTIILEDDCVPDPTFFRFCDELLDYYRSDKRVMMIGGRSNLYDTRIRKNSYYFSKLPACWGWATWKRAWQFFDMKVHLWPLMKNSDLLTDIMLNPEEVEYWAKLLDQAYTDAGEGDYWDFQWAFTCWVNHGLTILPTTNLITNIGFGEDATHTTSWNDKRSRVRATEMPFPLKHPPCMVRDRAADQSRYQYYAQSSSTGDRGLRRNIVRKLNKIRKKLI